MLINCDAQIYYGVPNPWDRVSPAGFTPSIPLNFWEMIASANFTTPGGDCGYFITNAADGTAIRFRNPHNASELRTAQTAYQCTVGPLPNGTTTFY